MSNTSDAEFWDNPELYIQGMDLNVTHNAGHYMVRDKEIMMDMFVVRPGRYGAMDIVRLSGSITSDSTIRLTEKVCNWCSENKIETYVTDTYDGIEYRFYRTDHRPDSGKIWFKKKRWYRKDLPKESRIGG